MRKIIHIDMDCFYAAVEMRDFPEYKNIPLAVGGTGPRSVLCTCNYEARKFGVRSAMSVIKAKQLCPNLKIVNGRMSVYKAISEQIHAIFKRYTSLIEPLSLDEAYLDVTDSNLHQGSATLIAEEIRAEIYKVTNLTASAGIAPLKFIAKVASDLNKPNGQFTVPPDNVLTFLETLKLNKIPGVGKVTYEKLKQLSLETCGDVQSSNQAILVKHFGKYGHVLWNRCHGIDNRTVQTNRVRKSVGVERTFAEDLTDVINMEDVIKSHLIPELNIRAQKHIQTRKISKVGVKIKFNDFQLTTKEQSFAEINPDLLIQLLHQALKRGNGKSVRLIGIHIGLAQPSTSIEQLDFDL